MFYKNFKKIRKAQGLSQKDIAEHLHITVQAISKWESGDVLPSTQYLPMLAKFLKCSIDDFFIEAPSPPKKQQQLNITAEIIKRYLILTKDWQKNNITTEQYSKALELIPYYCEIALEFFFWLESFQTITQKELALYLKCSDKTLTEIIQYLFDCEIISYLNQDNMFLVEKNAHEECSSLIREYALQHQNELSLSPEELIDFIMAIE